MCLVATDLGFARTDEILANGAEPHKLPTGFHIHVSPWPRNQYRTEDCRESPHPKITRNARRGRETSGPCKHLSFGDTEGSELLPTAHNRYLARIQDFELDGDPMAATLVAKGSRHRPQGLEVRLGTRGP